VVEVRKNRAQAGKHACYRRRDANIDPEQIARKGVGQVFPLYDELGESVQSEAAQQQTERRHHRHNAEIAWREQSG